jgi:hypothetical protein
VPQRNTFPPMTMNPIQRLSVSLAEASAAQEREPPPETIDRDDWLARVGDVARRLRAAARAPEGERAPPVADED